MNVSIEGFDYQAGLARMGSEESYREVVNVFVRSTSDLLKKIKTESLNKSISIKDYGIIVHGIKSSSRAIGAEAVGGKAEALEKAAKADDIAFVASNNDAFLQAVEKLLEGLVKLFPSKDESAKPRKAAPDQNLLIRLGKACGSYEIGEIDEIIEELEKYTYETNGDLVLWLREKIDNADFIEVKTKLLP